MKEKDLDNRLAPEGSKGPSKPVAPVTVVVPSPHGTGAEADLEKDYQLQRALELLRSMHMVKEQGFSFR